MKQSTKRIFAAALAALVVAAVGTTLTTQLPQLTNSVAYAATIVANGTCGAPYVNDGKNVTWELTDDGTLTISGTGAMKNYGKADADTADTPWKDYKNDIKKIVIEKEITSIGTNNFAFLPNLENITFEENSQLKIIGRQAFSNSGFTNITIPASVTTIEEGAFVDCSGLTSITLPSSVISIENRAFFYCTNLTTVTMEGSTPPTLEELVFLNTSLNTISVPVDALNKYKNACDKGEKGWNAAYKNMLAVGGDCGAEGHESDVKWAFKPATGTLTISGTGDMKGYNIINGVAQNLPWENYRTSIEKVVIESGITEIGSGSFADHTNLTEVTFAKNSKLKKIGGSAFLGCSGLTSITIPESVTTIVGWAFLGCTSLTSITIPSSVNSIGAYAFSACTSLTSITLPSSVTSIEKEAFSDCAKLTTVTMERSTPPTLGDNIFESCEELNTIFVPTTALSAYQHSDSSKGWDNYKSKLAIGGDCGADGHESDVTWKLQNGTLTISGKGKMADYWSVDDIPWLNYMDNINGIVIEEGVESIGVMAFYECTGLTSVTFAENSQLESIGGYAFDGCTNLTSITIPTSVTSIGAYAFNNCKALKNIDLPEELTKINQHAFVKSGLTGVIIPKSVDFIGIGAFSVCEQLDSVIMENETPCAVGPNIFGYENPGSLDTRSKFVKENTKGITVPYGSLEKYKSAENWSDYKNYMKEAPNPNPPAPSVPSQTTTQKPTTTDENGNTITGSITTYPDGSVVDVTIVTKPNGDTTTTVVEKDPQGNTTKTTKTKVETAADGTKTETETVTEAGKAPVITKTVTKKDGSQTIEKITSAENSRGNTVTTTETAAKDSKGNVVKKTTKKEIKNIGNGTSAVIDVDNNTALINKIGAAKPKGMQATINNKVLSQLKEANNGKDLLLTMIVKDKDGNKRYSVEVNTADLTPKNKLYIYKKDSKTGELYMVNGKAYIPDSKGQLKLIIRSKGDFVLKNAEDAAKINEKILSTVQAKKNKATLAKGKTEPFAFHEDLDMRNVKSISYETSDPRIATVNETGKIKGKKAGTATITATVTLKNGETKTLTMKVTVK